jgi:hypothetical protein
MSRLERFVVYPLLALLCVAVFGPRLRLGLPAAFAGEPVPKVVEAQQFRLVDSQGKERGSLSWGTEAAWGLALRDKSGQVRVSLGLNGDESPMLSLVDKARKARIVLQAMDDGTALVLLSDPSGTRRIGLDVMADGTPGLAMVDKDEKMRARLDMDSGEASITLIDKDGKTLWKAPSK